MSTKPQLFAASAGRISGHTAIKSGMDAERSQFILFIAKQYPSHLFMHPKDVVKTHPYTWGVCIHSPKGQLLWYIPDDDRFLFEYAKIHIGLYDYDGHTPEQKYQRLQALAAKPYAILDSTRGGDE